MKQNEQSEMSWYQKLQQWHDTRQGLLVYGLLELGLAYLFVIWAIDTGSLLDWFLAVVLLIGGVINLIRLIRKVLQRG